jgi:large subunit ribosomal protein L22
MEYKASLKYIRVTPRKAMLVADLVRGKNVAEALRILKFSPRRRTAGYFINLINSAKANAAQKGAYDLDNLFIHNLQVGTGPILKRFRARSKGSGTRINKKTSHIFLTLAER